MSLKSAVSNESIEFEAVARSSGYAGGIVNVLKDFPGNQATIKRLLVAFSKGDTETLYTSLESVRGSEDIKDSASGQQNLFFLLRVLFSISIHGQHQPFVEQLLKITPAPGIDMQEFLHRSGEMVSPQPESSPELWTLMIEHGWRSVVNKDELSQSLDYLLYHSDSKINIFGIVVLLLSYGVEVTSSHLHSAFLRGDIRVRDLLFKKIDRKILVDFRLLHRAVGGNHIKMAEWLIDIAKMHVNIIPTDVPATHVWDDLPVSYPGPPIKVVNGTPLHYAIDVNKKAMARLLLSRGANTNIKNEDGETAWDLAQRKGAWCMLGMMMFHEKVLKL